MSCLADIAYVPLFILCRRQAILTLLAATSCTFTGCGLNFAFGVFQDAYESEGGPFLNASPAKIDLIVRDVFFSSQFCLKILQGTLGVSVMTLGAPWVTSWTSMYGPGIVTVTGSVLFGLGMVLASFGTRVRYLIYLHSCLFTLWPTSLRPRAVMALSVRIFHS
jgi:uncharacterized membrane protein YedE/YeeE